MGKTNIFNVRVNKCLAEDVGKLKCLCDKADKGYKERDRTIERDKLSGK